VDKDTSLPSGFSKTITQSAKPEVAVVVGAVGAAVQRYNLKALIPYVVGSVLHPSFASTSVITPATVAHSAFVSPLKVKLIVKTKTDRKNIL
jgi:hypothetical protein